MSRDEVKLSRRSRHIVFTKRILPICHAAIALVVGLFTIFGAAVYLARAGDSPASCLKLTYLANQMLIDVDRGIYTSTTGYWASQVYDPQTMPQTRYRLNLPYDAIGSSPDGQVVVLRGASGTYISRVSAVSLTTPILIAPNSQPLIAWSSDSQLLVTIWSPDALSSPDQKMVLQISNPDGFVVSRINVLGAIVPYGWTADNTYFVYGVRLATPGVTTIELWSRTTGHIMHTGLTATTLTKYGYMPGFGLQLSPQQHDLAFLVSEGNVFSLMLYTPDEGVKYVFRLPDNPGAVNFLWSLDNQHVALAWETSSGVWQVSVYNSDGTSVPFVGKMVTNLGSNQPAMYWVQGGQRLVYVDRSTAQDWSMVAFDVARQQRTVLDTGHQGEAQLIVQLSSGRYLSLSFIGNTARESDSRIVDTTTGQRLPVPSGYVMANELGISPDGQLVASVFYDKLYLATIGTASAKVIPFDGQYAANTPLVWSPDSKEFAGYLEDQSGWVLAVFGRNGVLRHKFPVPASILAATPQWTRCGG